MTCHLKEEQKSVNEIIDMFANGNINISIDPINHVINTIENIIETLSIEEKIAMCHFNFDDLRNGTAWKIIKDYI